MTLTRSIIATAVLLAAFLTALATYWLLRTSTSNTKALNDATGIAHLEGFRKRGTSKPVDISNCVVSLERGEYFQFEIQVAHHRPSALSHPLLWHCEIELIDAFSAETSSKCAIPCFALNRLKKNEYMHSRWHKPCVTPDQYGLSTPRALSTINEEKLPFAVFMASPTRTKGSFPFRVLLYPEFHWVTPSRSSPGNPYLLATGCLIVE